MRGVLLETTTTWAQTEFGRARLRNLAQRKRLIAMAARCAARPAGQVTEVFSLSKEREGAYRFLEKRNVSSQALVAACAEAAFLRARGAPFVFVPVDGSSLSLSDPTGARGTGSVGARCFQSTGLEVMNAIVVLPDGTPAGLGAQQWWVRDAPPAVRKEKRALAEKETQHWLHAMQQVVTAADRVSQAPRPWFQLDRGGDFRELLEWMTQVPFWVTVRAAQNRRVLAEQAPFLWEQTEQQPLLGTSLLKVPAREHRQARTACLEIRTCRPTLLLKNKWTKHRWPIQLTVVLAREAGTTPPGEEPLEWLLLTNRPVTSLEDAQLVLRGYATRWRIEEFHRAWKTICQVEQSRLRSVQTLTNWATLLAAVAMRIERLKYLARTTPEQPATVELAPLEIKALVLLKEDERKPLTAPLTIGQAVLWIAEMGGYTSRKSAGGPPGAVTLGRGLVQLAQSVVTLRKLSEKTDQ